MEANDNEGKITSLFFKSYTDKARCKAAVPEFTDIHDFVLRYFVNAFSKIPTLPELEPDAQK